MATDVAFGSLASDGAEPAPNGELVCMALKSPAKRT
jgi:hypothetical protein